MEATLSAEYTIEKNVPMPMRSNGTEQFDVIDKMQVGDSILFSHKEWKRARNQAYMRKPKQFTFRRMANGYRCWRVQ